MEGVVLGAAFSLFLPSTLAFTRALLQVVNSNTDHDCDNDAANNIGHSNVTQRLLDALVSSTGNVPQLRDPLLQHGFHALAFNNTTAAFLVSSSASRVTSAINNSYTVTLSREGEHQDVEWLEECQSNSSSQWKLTSPVCSTRYASFLVFMLVTLLLAVITLWTILGNVLVLWALYRYRYLRTMSNCLIGNLAVSDLLLAITVLPISTANDLLGYWVFGRAMCTVWLCIDVLYCTASIWGLCTIAFDRYTATVYPMWYHDKRSTGKALAYMVFVWVFSIIISVAPFIGWQDMISNFYMYDPTTNRYMCILFSTKSYVIYSAMGSFVLPSCFMTFLYVKIFVELHRQSDALQKKSSVTLESPSLLLSNGGCPTISISATHDHVSCAVTRDATASTFMPEDTYVNRNDEVDEENCDTPHRRRGLSEEDDEDEEEEDDDGSSRCEYSPTRTEFDLDDICITNEPDPVHRTSHTARFSTGHAQDNAFSLRDHRINSLHVEVETSFLRAGTSGDGSGNNNNSVLLPEPPQKRDFLTVSACDIPMQFRMTKSRSAASDLQDMGDDGENGRSRRRGQFLTLTVPRSKSATTLCVGGHCRSRGEMQNGSGGGSGRGSCTSALSLHRLSLLPWHGRRARQMTTSMKRRFQLREQRATKRMLLIMACFFVCWVPFTLMYMLRSLCQHCPVLNDHLTACIIWLGYANSSLNPLLYTLFNDDFRKAFKKLLRFNRLRRPS